MGINKGPLEKNFCSITLLSPIRLLTQHIRCLARKTCVWGGMGDKINCLIVFYLLFSRVRMTKIPTLYFPNFFDIGTNAKHWKPSWKSIATNTKKKKKKWSSYNLTLLHLSKLHQLNKFACTNLTLRNNFPLKFGMLRNNFPLRFGMLNLKLKGIFSLYAKAMQINVFQWAPKKVISLYFVFKPPMFIDFILDKVNQNKIKWLLKGHIWNWSAKN